MVEGGEKGRGRGQKRRHRETGTASGHVFYLYPFPFPLCYLRLADAYHFAFGLSRRRGGVGGAGGLATSFSSAASTTSPMRETSMISSSCLTSVGISSMSASLREGRMMRLIPARCAASTFSLIPPTGKTSPESVISPVIEV